MSVNPKHIQDIMAAHNEGADLIPFTCRLSPVYMNPCPSVSESSEGRPRKLGAWNIQVDLPGYSLP